MKSTPGTEANRKWQGQCETKFGWHTNIAVPALSTIGLLKFAEEISDIEIHQCRSVSCSPYFQTIKDFSRLMEERLLDDGGSRKMAGKIPMFGIDPSALAGCAENDDRIF